MISVIYDREHMCVEINGHAMSGEAGHDLVCAAASILAYTLAQNLKSMKKSSEIYRYTLELDVGRAFISCVPHARCKVDTRLVFDAVCTGFALLSNQYPEYVSYEVHGR